MKSFVNPLRRFTQRALLILGLFGMAEVGWGQNSATWNNSTSGSAWYTTTNWTSSTTTNTYAGVKAVATSNTDIAIFGNTVGAVVGINMGTSSLSLGAISSNIVRLCCPA